MCTEARDGERWQFVNNSAILYGCAFRLMLIKLTVMAKRGNSGGNAPFFREIRQKSGNFLLFLVERLAFVVPNGY
jgi:hypothetical protein